MILSFFGMYLVNMKPLFGLREVQDRGDDRHDDDRSQAAKQKCFFSFHLISVVRKSRRFPLFPVLENNDPALDAGAFFYPLLYRPVYAD